MATICCCQCRHWSKLLHEGQCRINPPIVLLGHGTNCWETLWPVTNDKDWCSKAEKKD